MYYNCQRTGNSLYNSIIIKQKKSLLRMIYCAVFLLMISVTNTEVKSQGGTSAPCLPDCPNDVFIPLYPAPPAVASIQVCGITLQVEYRTRVACNTWYDFYLEAVTDNPAIPGDQLATVLATCFGGDINALLQAITEQMIIDNPMNFPPTSSGCEVNWRVMKGSCWRVDNQANYNPDSPAPISADSWIAPCEGTNCCLEGFEVCIDINGNRTITPGGYETPADPTCSQDPNPDCVPVCGSIYR